jgi:hypothetical protein
LRVLRGFIDAIYRFRTQAAETVTLLQEFLGFDDRHAVERLYEYYTSLLPVVPRPVFLEGIQHLREHFSQRYPAARAMLTCPQWGENRTRYTHCEFFAF